MCVIIIVVIKFYNTNSQTLYC